MWNPTHGKANRPLRDTKKAKMKGRLALGRSERRKIWEPQPSSLNDANMRRYHPQHPDPLWQISSPRLRARSLSIVSSKSARININDECGKEETAISYEAVVRKATKHLHLGLAVDGKPRERANVSPQMESRLGYPATIIAEECKCITVEVTVRGEEKVNPGEFARSP